MRNTNTANVSELPRIVNGVAVEDLFTTINAVKASPKIAKFNFRIQNQWAGGAQNSSTIGTFHGAGQEITRSTPFVLAADEHPVLLGKDGAANAVEYLLHALAACLTTSIVYHAAARGIEVQAVESSLEGDIDLHGFLGLDKNVRNGFEGIRVKFKIKADVSDQELQEIVQLGPGFSPVFDSLSHGVPITVWGERL
jgi:uncharacterized OsmC-like protein